MKKKFPLLNLLKHLMITRNPGGDDSPKYKFLLYTVIGCCFFSAITLKTVAQPTFSYAAKDLVVNTAITPFGPATSGVGTPPITLIRLRWHQVSAVLQVLLPMPPGMFLLPMLWLTPSPKYLMAAATQARCLLVQDLALLTA